MPRCNRAVKAAPVDEFVTEAALYLLEHLDLTEVPAPSSLSAEDQAAIDADRQELDELKGMWQSQELTTREYREMRKTVEARIQALQQKMIVRPTVESWTDSPAPTPARAGQL